MDNFEWRLEFELPFESVLDQPLESAKILSLRLGTQSEVIRGCSRDREISSFF